MLPRCSSRLIRTVSSSIALSRSFVTLSRPSVSSRFVSSQLSCSSLNHFTPVRSFAAVSVKVPSLGDSISEGTLVKWQKNAGEFVSLDEVIAVLETDKVSVDIRAPAAGILTNLLVKEGETLKVGADMGTIDNDGKASPTAAKPIPSASTQSPTPAPAPAAPKAAPQAPAAPAAAPAAKPAPAAAPKVTPSVSAPLPGSRTDRRVPMTRMRQTIATRLKHAQNTAASLSTFNEIDMTNIMELRNKYKDEFTEKHGIKFGFMSAFVKASTAALMKFPDVNAYIEGTDMVYHDFVDVSVAVSTPTGLVVPVLRNTENMSFAQIEAAIFNLGQKARKNQIAIEDMIGGTFTISNGGVYGSMFGTPILNPPQSAILGMHGIFKRPVVVNDKVEIRPMMYIALTYDHRIIDGATAVQFLKEIKANVEDPARLLLSL
jgi:2-oxoglutarate dehydrogenase E2 component (dihydrolipoamide succinyltransferase)